LCPKLVKQPKITPAKVPEQFLNHKITITCEIQTTNPTKNRPKTICCGIAEMKLESLSFRDRFGILLEKKFSGVAELRYTMVYGKSQKKEQ
jgi:hypothetical protein